MTQTIRIFRKDKSLYSETLKPPSSCELKGEYVNFYKNGSLDSLYKVYRIDLGEFVEIITKNDEEWKD